MNNFLRIAAYLFHPLLMPLLGTFLYFIITPRFVDPELIRAKLIAVAIITLLIPLITFFLLKNLKIVSSVQLEEVQERKVPLMIQSVLLLLIIKLVFDPYDSIELYYFFVGILFSAIAALILVFFKFKLSLHQMGIAGVTMFLIALSIHFKINLLLWIVLLFFANGWVASSRLHTESHDYSEIITGFFVGVVPQFILLNFWL
jgi:membrane-associated HD superfamily phosphohydrolase